MSRVNYIVWGFLFLFGGFIIHESLDHSYYGSDFGPGPGFFSFWLGILLMLLSLGQLVATFRRPAETLPKSFIPGQDGRKRMLSILGALAASLLLMNKLGFSLTILAFSIFLLRTLGRQSWWLTIVLAVVGSFGMAYLFRLLQVMLPRGFLGI
jgi:putative tricarboxylic transport membrane protein